jgi:hypothetical protein
MIVAFNKVVWGLNIHASKKNVACSYLSSGQLIVWILSTHTCTKTFKVGSDGVQHELLAFDGSEAVG